MAKIKKKNLLRIGFDEGDALKLALQAMQHEVYAKKGREVKLSLMQELLAYPEQFYQHQILGATAKALKAPDDLENTAIFPDLSPESLPYQIYGKPEIAPGAIQQMDIASRLPVALGAALMLSLIHISEPTRPY